MTQTYTTNVKYSYTFVLKSKYKDVDVVVGGWGVRYIFQELRTVL